MSLADDLLALLDRAAPVTSHPVTSVTSGNFGGVTGLPGKNQSGNQGNPGNPKNIGNHAQTDTPAPRVYRFRLRGQSGDCTLIAGAWGPDEAMEDLRERYGDRLVEVREVAP